MRKTFSIVVACLLASLSLSAQTTKTGTAVNADSTSQYVQAYVDSLMRYRQQLDSLRSVNAALRALNQPSPDYARLFVPLKFYPSVAANQFSLTEETGYNPVDAALLNIYLHHPELVEGKMVTVASAKLPELKPAPVSTTTDIVRKVAPKADEVAAGPVDVMVEKPNFWTRSGDFNFQLFQNYFSSNWYKGGESNYSFLGTLVLQANYNNKQKVKWDNKLEVKLGMLTSKADSLHSLKTSEDLLRYTGKLGLQATKKWYYTVQLLAWTQMLRGYKSNDNFVYSDIMSPFNLNVSIGMDYNVSWLKKRLTGTVHLSPMAYNFKYCGRSTLVTRNGIDEGKHSMHDFGPNYTIDLTWKILNSLSWRCRMYGFSSYHRAEVEFENTIKFQLSKNLNCTFFVHPRFDDNRKRDDKHGYWQYKEYLTFGFNYSF